MALKWKLSKLYVASEGSNFGVEVDADGSDYKFLPCLSDVTFQPMVTVIEREAQVNKFTRQAHVMGAKAGTLAFKLYLKASGLAAALTAAAAAEADPILTALFGSVSRGTTSAITGASSTTGTLYLDAITGMTAGMAIRVSVSGVQYHRFITAFPGGNSITLDRVLPGIPSAGTVVYVSSAYRPADNGHNSLSFVGNRDGIEYTFRGCNPSCKLSSISGNGLAVLEVSCSVADWAVTTKGSLATTVPTGITAVAPPAIKGTPFALGGVEEAVYGFEFDFGIKFELQDSTNGGGLAGGDGVNFGFEKTDGEANGVIKSYYVAAHMTDFLAGTEKIIALSAGTHLNGWGLYIFKSQYLQPQFEEHKGTVGESLSFKVNDSGSEIYDFVLSVF